MSIRKSTINDINVALEPLYLITAPGNNTLISFDSLGNAINSDISTTVISNFLTNQNSQILSTVLTDFDYTSSTGYIAPTDTILTALQKSQYQLNSIVDSKGANNGIATLDSSGKLSSSQIPASLIGAMVYQGTWNANTNVPTLVSSIGIKGNYYIVSVQGSTLIDGISTWNVNDWIVFDGTTWEKIDNSTVNVLNTPLNGLTTGINTPILSTNTVLTAFQNTQAQIDNKANVNSGTQNYLPYFSTSNTLSTSLIYHSATTNNNGSSTLISSNNTATESLTINDFSGNKLVGIRNDGRFIFRSTSIQINDRNNTESSAIYIGAGDNIYDTHFYLASRLTGTNDFISFYNTNASLKTFYYDYNSVLNLQSINTTNSTSLLKMYKSDNTQILSFNNNGLVMGSLPQDVSSIIDLQTTSQGLGLPKLLSSQKTAITTSRKGLLVYDDTLKALSYWTGTEWASTVNNTSTPTPSAIPYYDSSNNTLEDSTLLYTPGSANLLSLTDVDTTDKTLFAINSFGSTDNLRVSHNYTTDKTTHTYNHLNQIVANLSDGDVKIGGTNHISSTSSSSDHISFTDVASNINVWRTSNTGNTFLRTTDNTATNKFFTFTNFGGTQIGYIENGGMVIGSDTRNTNLTLDLQSITQSFGIPLLTTLNENNINPNVRKGMLHYNTTSDVLRYSDGISWNNIVSMSVLTSALSTKFNIPTGTTAEYIAGDGSLITFPSFNQAQRLVTLVRNNTGNTITSGTAVYINGAIGNKPTIDKASALSSSLSDYTLGLTQNDISDNSDGYIVVSGNLVGVDTSSYVEGSMLYLSTVAGQLTTVKPTQPNHAVVICIVTRQHPSLGAVEITIENGTHLTDLHDTLITSPTNNQVLTYETSSGLWKNKDITSVGTITSGTWNGTAIADAYISSASTWNGKLDVSGGTLTGALNEAPIVTLASANNVDIVNISSNTAYITGTTGIATFTTGTSGMVRKVQFASVLILQGGNNIRLPNATATLTTSAKDVGTFIYNSTDSIWYCISYTRGSASSLTTNRLVYYNGTDIVTTNLQYLSSGTEVRYVDNSVISFNSNEYIQGGSSIGLNLKITNGEINLNRNNLSKIRLEGNSIQYQSPDQYFGSYALADQFGRWTSGGLLIGSHGTINSATSLDLQSITKGIGLPLVPTASLPTASTRKGNLMYDSTLNIAKVSDGTIYQNASYTAGTASQFVKADGSLDSNNYQGTNLTQTTTSATTVTLTASSNSVQRFTGTLTQLVVMPNATTLVLGRTFTIINDSSATITVQRNGGGALATITAGARADLRCVDISTASGGFASTQTDYFGTGTWTWGRGFLNYQIAPVSGTNGAFFTHYNEGTTGQNTAFYRYRNNDVTTTSVPSAVWSCDSNGPAYNINRPFFHFTASSLQSGANASFLTIYQDRVRVHSKLVVGDGGTLSTTAVPNAAVSLDLQSTTLGLGLNLVPTASLPTASTRKGNLLFDSTTNTLKVSDGTNWVSPLIPTGITTNNVPKWNGTTFTNSTIQDDNTKLQIGNTTYIGATANGFAGNLVYIVDFANTGTKTLFRVDPKGASSGSLNITHSYTTAKSTVSFNNLAQADFTSSLGTAGGFGAFGNNLFAQNTGFTGNIFGCYNTTTDTYVFQVANGGAISSTSINGTESTAIHSFNSKTGGLIAAIRNGGLSLGSNAINTATSLDLQSTTKGVGLPLVATASLPSASTRKGNLLFNSTSNVLTVSDGTNWNTVNTGVSSAVMVGILNADQGVTTSTDIVPDFVAQADPNGWFNNTNKRVTPTIAGYYNVSYNVWWGANSSSNQVNVQIRKNDNSQAIYQRLSSSVAIGFTMGGSKVVYMNGTTDYFDFAVFTSDANTIFKGNVDGSGTYFSIHLLR